MSEEFYDVVIVGAGVTGAIMARQLAEKGKRILVLEAGSGEGLQAGGFSSFLKRYYLNNLKTPTDPYPNNINAPIDGPGSAYYEQLGPQRFGSNYNRVAGGTTLHWMGTCLRFLPEDFRLKELYNQGIDWPIDYEDLEPYYQKAEWELGVSANVEDQESLDPEFRLFKEGYNFPMQRMPPSCLDRDLNDRMKGLSINYAGEDKSFSTSSTPAARNSIPRDNLVDPRNGRKLAVGEYYRPVGALDFPDERGQRCQGNASCIPICPVQAKYSALKTLQHAIEGKYGDVNLLTQAVASLIEVEPGSGRVTGIKYKKYYDPNSAVFKEHVAHGRTYVLAAHAVENAKLLLASHVANSSDMVGRNLMDHPFVITWGLMPNPIHPYRGPGSTSGIPQMRDGAFRKDFAAFRIEIGNWGVDFPNGTPKTTIRSLVDRESFNASFPYGHPETHRQNEYEHDLHGTNLREKIKHICSRQFRLGFELEQLPDTGNRITVDPRYRDAIGNFRPVISYKLDDYCRLGIVEAVKLSEQIYDHSGVTDETNGYHPANPIAAGNFEFCRNGETKRYEYFGAGHICGTHRMGNSPRDSVVRPDQRTWDHENLYLVGCGNFCTVGTANPTLTAAALAFQAAENILRDLG